MAQSLIVNQKSIYGIFTDGSPVYSIPEYQRPYAWDEDKCEVLWDDLYAFCIPNGNPDEFKFETEQYYLGSIVTFTNDKTHKLEVIDGQQRIVTIQLLLRALLKKFNNSIDEQSIEISRKIKRSLWKTNEAGEPDMNSPRVESKVITDEDKEEFSEILNKGDVEPKWKSNFATNFKLFQKKIEHLLLEHNTYLVPFTKRVIDNVILLPIQAQTQDSALRIFSTLNDRGMPLSDADIFKSKLYYEYSQTNNQASFIQEWKWLEQNAKSLATSNLNGMGELFTRYMYFERAKQNNKNTTVKALRDFYTENNLINKETFENIKKLGNFWRAIQEQDATVFGLEALRQLYVLSQSHNRMWTYMVSVYFMAYSNKEGKLKEPDFTNFLKKLTVFILAYNLGKTNANDLRTPLFPEMINIVNHKTVDYSPFKFEEESIRNTIANFHFNNNRRITKAFLTWLAFQNSRQDKFPLNTGLQIEHIYSKKRAEFEGLENIDNLESIGNKSILEAKINSSASDYKFTDKKKIYANKKTQIKDLIDLCEKDDFTEKDIKDRKDKIIKNFIACLKDNNLLKTSNN